MNRNWHCINLQIAMRKSIFLFGCISLLTIHILFSQTVIVTDDSTYITGQASAVLELKSTTKGFLPPRVTAVQKLAIASPAAGLLVYQTDGTAGYYLWTGTRWDPMISGIGGNGTPINKTTATTLLKTETFVLASNDITLTLPEIVSADNGLSISVKNIGSYTNLVQIKANGTATIDGTSVLSNLTRWHSRTYIAFEGNWLLKEKANGLIITEYEVSPGGSWTTIAEALAYLALHMSGPAMIRLGVGVFPVSATQTINLPYPLTIAGVSFGETVINASIGVAGSPMFNCTSETNFKMIRFDATSLAGYGTDANEDAIWLIGSRNYYEVKDAEFIGFNKAVVIKTNVEFFMFDTDIRDAVVSGIEVAAGANSGVIFKISETDFTNCHLGISLKSGINSIISVINCGFYLKDQTDICIDYTPVTFTPFTTIFIATNTWNITGSFLQGFDFTRTDGRDANAYILNNLGDVNHNPSCKIDVINNNTTTTLHNANNWYKAEWTNTLNLTSKWVISNNRITYLPLNKRDALVMITGNLSVNSSNKTVSIALIKNGVVATPIGETTLRITTSNQPFQFATVIYLQNISKNDYFEIWCKSINSNDVVTFQDIQWLTETK